MHILLLTLHAVLQNPYLCDSFKKYKCCHSVILLEKISFVQGRILLIAMYKRDGQDLKFGLFVCLLFFFFLMFGTG